MKVKWIVAVTLSTLLSIPSLSMGRENTHFFDCTECHLSGGTLNELAVGNICIRCHNAAAPLSTTFNAGSRYNSAGQHAITPSANFDIGDASDSFGNNNTDAYAETSHHWATSTTFNPAAGSKEPNRTLYPNMYSKYNVSTGRLTCSRCHDPHGDYLTNPKLLRLSADYSTPMTENQLCVACHADLDLPRGNHGLMGHPIDMNYAASVAAKPGAYKPTIDNGTNGDLQLLAGLVTCLTCHGVHATDSNADTVDGFAGSPGFGDGLLLRHNGPGKADPVAKDGICNACHEYQGHAMSSGTPLDCMVCHGGHEYDATAPNYYMLKKQVTLPFVPKLGSGGTVTLDYTVDPTTTSDFTNGTAINGALCLNCHNLPGSHSPSDSCGSCHSHDSPTASFAASCGSCHGFAPSLNAQGNLTGGGYAFSSTTGNNYAASGVFKDESATPHARHANGASNYTFSCADCHGDGSGVLSDLPGAGKHDGGTFQQVLDNGLGSLTSLASASGILSPVYNASNQGSCTAVYCHSNGRVQGRPESAVIATVAAGPWANGANTISSCDVCHDVQVGGSKNHSPSHDIHLAKGYTCGTCHNETSTDGLSLITSAIGGIHVNGTVDATFSGIANLGAGGVYDDTQGTCATYCHSNGKGISAETPDWDVANTGNCGDCHGGPSGADSIIASGSHTKHLNNGISCDDCHGAGAQTGTHSGHLDGDGPFAYDIPVSCNVCHGATGGETTGADREPIWGLSTSVDCETCHSGSVLSVIGSSTAPDKNEALSTGHNLASGNYLVTNNPAAAAGCTDCHDATAAGHFDAPGDTRLVGGFDCMNCHDGSTATLVQTHTNVGDTFQDYTDFTQLCSACHDPHGGGSNAAMINIPGVVFSSRTLTNSFDEADTANADDLCATCHINTTHNNTAATGSHKEGEDCMSCHAHAQGFNPVGGDSCDDCHANVGTGGLSGAHGAHNTVAFNGLLSNGDYGSAAAGWYNVNYVNGVPSFACGYCHPSTIAGHMSKQISLNPADAGAAGTVKAMNIGSAVYSLGVCSATYCHSDGVNIAAGVSPNWSTGSISDNCTDCHGNSPTTAAHGVHEVGIHYQELYDDDGVGLMAASPNELGVSGGADSAHGNSVTSSTITCFTCHRDTVTDSANAANSTCGNCHSDLNSVIDGNGNARILTSSSTHLNGVKDVSFADLTAFKSKAQVRGNLADADDGTNVLSAIWNRITGYKAAGSHDTAQAAFGTPTFTQGADTCSSVACHNGNTATWSDSGVDCMYCHTSLPR